MVAFTPIVGDDAQGLRAVAQSLDVIAANGVRPLLKIVGQLDHLTVDGRVDLDLVANLEPVVSRAHRSFAEAAGLVSELDSSGYLGFARADFDTYVGAVVDAERALASAQQSLELVPPMVGASGPRDYLVVFENNAEIRATGGLPGSWALVHADDGLLTMRRARNR